MSLQDHVPDRELCEKWKSVGGRQDTEFAWKIAPGLKIVAPSLSGYNCEHESFAAPLASELMEWLKIDIGCVWYLHSKNMWTVEPIEGDALSDKMYPNALMKMAIGLKMGEK